MKIILIYDELGQKYQYKIGKIKNDNVYLDLGNSWVEVLKICNGIINKKY